MALVLADRVRETTTVTGTGTATLLGAVSGYQSFSAVGNANTTYYVIANQSATEWEVGIGTYTSSGTTLSRDTVLSSSNSGSLVNFSAGTKDVFVDYPAGKAVYEDAAGNVDGYPITGGTINNTTVGATTPAAGTFTTLTATGQTDLGGPVGNPAFRVFGSTPIQYIDVQGSTSGTTTIRSWSTNASSSSLLFQTRATGNFTFATGGSSGTVQAVIGHTSSAVNYVQVTGAATGAPSQPIISAQGSDANINIAIQGKGTGAAVLLDSGGGSTLQAIPRATGGDTFLSVQRNVGAVVLSAASGVSNGNLVLQPKGTGALQAQQTDSTATGGNARGANAVDWQTARDNASRVASGSSGVVGGGFANTASSFASTVAGGYVNIASNIYTGVLSGFTNTASGQFSSIVGGSTNTAAGTLNFIGGGFTNSGTSGSAVTTQSATMNATTAVTLSGSNASIKVGQYITGTSIASDTYVAAISGTSLTLSKVASGSSTSTLSFYTPHGVVVGGGNNQATGSYSFIGGGGDAGTAANRNVASGAWSTVAGGVKNVASGVSSFVGGGGTDGAGTYYSNTASGISSVISGGWNNNNSGSYGVIAGGQSNTVSNSIATIAGGTNNYADGFGSAIVGGTYGTTRAISGNIVFPASVSPISSSIYGASQAALLVLGVQTTDATATVLRSNTSAAGTANQVILPNNSAYYFKGSVIANVTGGGNTKGWTIEGAIKRGANAASTALVGTPTVTSGYADVGAATWAIAVTADTTNGGLAVTFTGQAATTIRCVAKLETTEVTF